MPDHVCIKFNFPVFCFSDMEIFNSIMYIKFPQRCILTFLEILQMVAIFLSQISFVNIYLTFSKISYLCYLTKIVENFTVILGQNQSPLVSPEIFFWK